MNGTEEFKEQLLRLAAEGRITPEEGEQLLKARRDRWGFLKSLWDPFAHLSYRTLLILAGVSLLGALILARAGCRFDGALDLHVQPMLLDWRAVTLQFSVSCPLFAVFLWGVALTLARRTRLIDLFVTILVARIPELVSSVPMLFVIRRLGPNPMEHMAVLVVVGLLALPFIVWNIILLVLGIRNATGLHGSRLALVAVIGLLGAEVLSQLVLHFVH